MAGKTPGKGNEKDGRNAMSLYQFISARHDRAFDQWGQKRDEKRAKYMLQSMCPYMNLDNAAGVTTLKSDTKGTSISRTVVDDVSLELIWTYHDIVPPPTKVTATSTERWKKTSFPRQKKIKVSCK